MGFLGQKYFKRIKLAAKIKVQQDRKPLGKAKSRKDRLIFWSDKIAKLSYVHAF